MYYYWFRKTYTMKPNINFSLFKRDGAMCLDVNMLIFFSGLLSHVRGLFRILSNIYDGRFDEIINSF